MSVEITQQPTIIIVGGPNGAGKTTFAREFLPNEAACLNFINVDLIAQGLSPFRPEAAAVLAGRMMIAQMARFVAKRESFSFESTLSGKYHARLIEDWKRQGYFVVLYYLRLANVEIAVSRVAARVEQGGHSVREADLRRRFGRSGRNFEELYRPLVNDWHLYDNSGSAPVLAAQGGLE